MKTYTAFRQDCLPIRGSRTPAGFSDWQIEFVRVGKVNGADALDALRRAQAHFGRAVAVAEEKLQ